MQLNNLEKNELIKTIEHMIINSELNNQPGSLLYSSISTLSKSKLYFLGLNPGGVPDNKSTILDHLNFMTDVNNKNFNEYCDGIWKPGGIERPRGQSILQRRVQFLLSSLANNTRNVFASNLIFKRSTNEAMLNNKNVLAEICWKIHLKFLSIVNPSLILVMGNFCFEFIRSKMINIVDYKSFVSGHANWECEFVKGELNEMKTKLIKIPHLSRYNIVANHEVVDWIKLIGLDNNIN